MMKKIFFALPGNEAQTGAICRQLKEEMGEFTLRRFPDDETYLRILSPVAGKHCILVCSLNHPDQKIIPLYYISRLCKELNAAKVTLIAPYLSYMRQDIRFNVGEAVTSEYFAALISGWVDELITIDPHLHRKHSMEELYTIPCKVLHAAPVIAEWIRNNIKNPVLIGPDIESAQWVSEVAKRIGSPHLILLKQRFGDKEVRVTVPDIEDYRKHIPVLIDDIISTARTMVETVRNLKDAGMTAPVVIGVHAIFSGDAFRELNEAGAGDIITCNTINHASNGIDLTELITFNLS